ncbi:MAG TPA: NADPH-dependent 7-cyano-7-deazaguanine reductase QueF [Hydrogenophaga sp.]|uniref:NADPH-dependent 7-cyano-7-deazaguanine reductase QueF n=1 Tax=Hydrogenophaga sp. TaxID=1904254 RepID=UPI002BBFCBE3|nr:NADPH-dependent 7-cyano-7-deazaguanine reductase QueF [Hydrogenophaga sp.]HMN93991.1 NADPH-dependent 7-cyano-7-deazaguanine reductase QueF [Hydrogenophaga sp.]HMP09389.1 NADPH-dependent 7-cyano-7-deazaguanine reductase QueF [Hydrogenophaga sp.]
MSTQQPDLSPLGKATPFVDRYDPTLLYPLPREPKRREIGIAGSVPFLGADLWTAFELSWLNPRGKPVVALAHITVPCESTHIVESKSFKLYLNSFSGTRFDSADAVRDRIRQDISQAIWHGEAVQSSVGIRLLLPDLFACEPVQELDGLNLDRLDVECTHDRPAPELLTAAFDEKPVDEVLVSHLLKSNCLVTGQPDWGSVQIRYSGPQIDQAGLLQYIVSFRRHHEFHEQCVERIYMDIMSRCKPARLMVYARYTRRGGLDINPWRSSHPQLPPPNVRTARQ